MDEFNWIYYISAYEDLRKAGINTKEKALLHWNKFGKKEGRTCNSNSIKKIKECPFDWKFYTTIYPDIKALNLDKETALLHWKNYGINNRICCLEKLQSIFNENLSKIDKELFIYKKQRDILIKKNIIKKEELINILIRTSNRPNLFKSCIDSILNQHYSNYKVIITYDKIESLEYLKKYENNNKIQYYFINIDNPNKYKFNLYCNFLIDKVNDGYIMFLDDDDILTHNYVLNIINDNLKLNNNLLIWKFMRPDRLIYPKDINNIILGTIDTTCFCFHNSFKNTTKWTDKQCGDFYFITDLISKNKFNIKFINFILTRTSYNNKIANYGN